MKRLFLFTAICIFLCAMLCTCRFSTEWGLVEYLEDKGRPADGTYQLAPVTAYENDGSGEKELESGMLFYSGRTIRLVAPSLTLQDVPVSDVDVYYTLKKYNSLKHYYDTVLCTNIKSVASENGIKRTYDIVGNGLELSYGQYWLEAYAQKSGYTDSEKKIWAFQIGWDTIIMVVIELEDGYRLGYELDNLTFSEKSLNKSENNIITVTPHVYKIKGKDNEGNDILQAVEIPEDLPEPTLELSYKTDKGIPIKGTSYVKNASGNYEFKIPANELAEDALGTGKVIFRVRNSYKKIAFDGSMDLTIVE